MPLGNGNIPTGPEGSGVLYIDENGNLSIYANGTASVVGGGGSSYTPPYLVYTAAINQAGIDAPSVITEFENTFGVSFTWVRESTGQYRLDGGAGFDKFVVGKTWAIAHGRSNDSQHGPKFNVNTIEQPGSYILITNENDSDVRVDGFAGVSVEIRVYP